MDKYAQSAGNWDAAIWYSASSGGSPVSKPVAGDNAYLNGVNVTANENIECDLIEGANDTTSILTVDSGPRIITADIIYLGTATAGMVRHTTSSLTINGKVTNSSSGYCIVSTNANCTGLYINTPSGGDGVALLRDGASSTGRCVSHAGANNVLEINGDLECQAAGSGYVLISSSSNDNKVFNGNIVISNGSYNLYSSAGTLTWNVPTTGINIHRTGGSIPLWIGSSGVFIINAERLNCVATSTNNNFLFYLASTGNCTWVGRCVIPEESSIMMHIGNPLILANDSTFLDLENYGTLMISKSQFSTRGVTISAAAGTASIKNMTEYATTSIAGVDNTTRSIISRHTRRPFFFPIKKV
jgi:hypothetical protein